MKYRKSRKNRNHERKEMENMMRNNSNRIEN
jgi:hypothetical protein